LNQQWAARKKTGLRNQGQMGNTTEEFKDVFEPISTTIITSCPPHTFCLRLQHARWHLIAKEELTVLFEPVTTIITINTNCPPYRFCLRLKHAGRRLK
jgi:hypothetical protein